MKSDGLPVVEVNDEIRVGADRDGVFLTVLGRNYDGGSLVSASIVITPTEAKALVAGLRTAIGAIEDEEKAV